MKAYTKLLGLDYKIVYKKGTYNSATDALSRFPSVSHCQPMDLYALSTSQPDWMHQLTVTYTQLRATAQLLTSLVVVIFLRIMELSSLNLEYGLPAVCPYNSKSLLLCIPQL